MHLFQLQLTGTLKIRSAFEGEIEAIKIALGQLCSQSAVRSIGSREPPKTAEIHECKNCFSYSMKKNKTKILQWIPEHCGMIGNERADTLAKKGTTILQAINRSVSFCTMKTLIRKEFKTSRSNELKARTKEKEWTAALSNIADWPRIEAEEMGKAHLIRCPALQTTTETQRYWEARTQLTR
nr:reverse transcriptase [Hymenolepis microstoma]CUU99424.1 reverse transcriptase [Hymenolepis microstoma]